MSHSHHGSRPPGCSLHRKCTWRCRLGLALCGCHPSVLTGRASSRGRHSPSGRASLACPSTTFTVKPSLAVSAVTISWISFASSPHILLESFHYHFLSQFWKPMFQIQESVVWQHLLVTHNQNQSKFFRAAKWFFASFRVFHLCIVVY